MKRKSKENTLLYMLSHVKEHGLLYGVCALMMCCYPLAESVLTGQLYGIILNIGAQTGENLSRALLLLGIMAAVVVLCALAAVRFYFIALGADKKLGVKMVSRLIRTPFTIWYSRHEADWLALVGKDRETASQAYKAQVIALMGFIVSIVGGFYVVGTVHLGYALSAALLGLCYFWIGVLRSRSMRKYADQQRAAFNEASAQLQNQYEGSLLLRFYSIGAVLKQRFMEAVGKLYEFSMRAAKLNVINGALGQLGYVLIYTGTLLIGMLLVWRGSLTAQVMLSLWPVAIGIGFSINRLGFFHTEYQVTASAVHRIAEVDELPVETSVQASPLKMPHGPVLRVERLSFSYDGERDALKNVSIEVNEREKVCVVGESGSGKSTLVKLILRMYEAKNGAIHVNGARAEAYPLEAYRGTFAYIPQTPRLFSVSVFDNIRMGDLSESGAAVEDAARRARADGFIAKLPKGYDSVLGEEGLSLSGGEQQRIAIARAYMRKNALLVCDEMTAALDGESESAIMDTIWSDAESTVLFITHHLKNASRADRIIVMKDGAVVETGTQRELLERKGYYYELWAAQA